LVIQITFNCNISHLEKGKFENMSHSPKYDEIYIFNAFEKPLTLSLPRHGSANYVEQFHWFSFFMGPQQ
jgi:hypothetical protein